ncbi:MAG: TlpA family protein disulfide reductase [Candidatus Omnitrophica bacterium]|nr:TlpA family protein disulfide reductase [Candidatus Omnitrophota bacterium]
MKNKIYGFITFLLIMFILLCFRSPLANAQGLAPDFRLEDIKGGLVSLSDYRDKNAVILLFWTTWCPYCRDDIKNLNSIYEELKKDGFEVLAVNVGEALYKVDNFTRSYRLNYRVLLDKDTSVAVSYGAVGIPFYLIIDKKGVVRFADNYFPRREYKELALR